MQRYKRNNYSDPDTKRLSDNCAVCFDSIISNPLINGILLTKIVLKTALGDNIVSHGLGRNYIGYVVVNNNNAAVVYTSGTTNTLPGLNIILKTTADCTVSLFIF